MRGFRRTNPAAPHSSKDPVPKKKSTPSTHSPSGGAPKTTTEAPGRKAPSPIPPRPTPGENHSPSNENEQGNVQVGRYCHYYVNQGDCRHEERTGNKCRYEHKVASMCNFGMSCSRV